MKSLIKNALFLALFAGCVYLVWNAKSAIFVPGASEFIKKYFETWSRHDLNAYAKTFDSRARIYVKEPGSSQVEYGLDSFLEMQRNVFASQPTAREEATSITVTNKDADGKVTAEVRWVLYIGGKQFTGTDRFKLKQIEGNWYILELTIQNDTPIKL